MWILETTLQFIEVAYQLPTQKGRAPAVLVKLASHTNREMRIKKESYALKEENIYTNENRTAQAKKFL